MNMQSDGVGLHIIDNVCLRMHICLVHFTMFPELYTHCCSANSGVSLNGAIAKPFISMFLWIHPVWTNPPQKQRSDEADCLCACSVCERMAEH